MCDGRNYSIFPNLTLQVTMIHKEVSITMGILATRLPGHNADNCEFSRTKYVLLKPRDNAKHVMCKDGNVWKWPGIIDSLEQ